jgi:hypothetical protein
LESADAKIPEWRACAQLIYHLGNTYQHFVLNELSKTPLKNQRLERLCGALFAEETRLQEQSQGLFAANATRSRGQYSSSSSNRSPQAVCQRCKDEGREKINHKNEKCWFNKKDNYANMPPHLRKKLLEQDQDSKKEDSKNEGRSYGIIARSRPMTSLAMAVSRSSSSTIQDTYLDTCSDNHIVGSIDLLHNVRPTTMQLEWGEGYLIKVEGIGTRIVQTAVGDVTNTLTIANVYYVPGFINILSYMRMRDKGMLFEDDGKQPRLRFKDKDNTVAYVNMPAKGEKGLPSLLLRDIVIDETLTTQDDPGEYELVAPGPQEYLLSPIVPLENEEELEDTSATPLDDPGKYELVAPGPLSPIVPLEGEEELEDTSAISRDDSDKDTYEDPQEFEPPPPTAAPIVLARPQRSTANKPPTRYENELAKQKTLHEYMHKMGFVPSPADPCLFTMGTITIAV